VHSWANSYLRHIWNPFVEEKHPSYVGGLKKWFKDNKAKLIFGEGQLINKKMGFNGHADFVGTIDEEDEIGLIDFKTSQASQPWWKLQLAAYLNLFDCNRKEMGLGKIGWTASLRVDRDGEVSFERYSREEMENKYFPRFKNMLDYFYLSRPGGCKDRDSSFLEEVRAVRKKTSKDVNKVLANYVRYGTSHTRSLFKGE
jgi:hypothetical protein